MASANRSSKWTDALLDRMQNTGDELADKPVGKVFEAGGVDAVNAIMRTLVRNDQPVPDELPPQIRDYLAESLALPEWADLDKIKRGQQLYETWGVLITLCLFCASLPASYAAADGVKVLYLTARLDTDARRRVMETGQFLIDVLTVGGLDDEHGKGRRTIQRVRLMHAAVRHLIMARNDQGAPPVCGDEPPCGIRTGAHRSIRKTSPGRALRSRISSPIRCLGWGFACPPRTLTPTCTYGTSSAT